MTDVSGDTSEKMLSYNSQKHQNNIETQTAEIAGTRTGLNKPLEENRRLIQIFDSSQLSNVL